MLVIIKKTAVRWLITCSVCLHIFICSNNNDGYNSYCM